MEKPLNPQARKRTQTRTLSGKHNGIFAQCLGKKNCPGIGQTANYKGAIANPEFISDFVFLGSSFPLKKMSVFGTKIPICKGVPFGQNFLT
jgi:hypothetical protein